MARSKLTREEIDRSRRIKRNIKAVRCWLQMDKTEFAKFTKLGRRALDLETRATATEDEISLIAKIAGIPPEHITEKNIVLRILVIS